MNWKIAFLLVGMFAGPGCDRRELYIAATPRTNGTWSAVAPTDAGPVVVVVQFEGGNQIQLRLDPAAFAPKQSSEEFPFWACLEIFLILLMMSGVVICGIYDVNSRRRRRAKYKPGPE